MPRKKPPATDDAPLVLTPPKTTKPRTKKAKASNRRVRTTPTVAVVTMLDGVGVTLDVNDVLTKNERYTPVRFGKRIAQREMPCSIAYKEAVKLAAVKCCGAAVLLGKGIRTGLWRLEVHSTWPTQRHHDDGTDTAFGDSDAPIAMVKDAMQHAGIIDDDMRIVGETTHAVYQKGVRRTVAILRRVSAEDHAAQAAAVLAVLG